MAASQPVSNVGVLSKAEYLKRYLGEDDCRKSKENKTKKKRIKPHEKGMKIVDDDIDWKQLVNTEEKENHEEDEEEAPVVAEFIDERPEEIKRLEEFRTSNKWRVMGAASDDSQEAHQEFSVHSNEETQRQTKKASPRLRHDSPDAPATKSFRHDSPDLLPVRKGRHDSPVKKSRHDSPDLSPVRNCHDSPPDLSPKRKNADLRKEHPGSRPSFPAQRKHSSSPSTFLKKQKGSSPSRRKHQFGKRRDSDSDLSPQRRVSSSSPTSDLSPPRKRPHQKNRGSDSDLSPPRRSRNAGRNSDSDLSPPRRVLHRSPDAQKMLSGGAAGLVSVEVLKREKEEKRKRDKKNQPLEDESHNAKTVFRDKSGRRRDIEQEREEQRKRAGEQAEKDKKYAQWGKGLAQAQMQEQNVKDAIKEAQKPLARYADDEDLDKMLREQEREGDPMAEMLRKKKEKDSQRKGVKEMPRYKGPPPPPNRFNIMPGYRWDGVDRSNGFEKQRYSRLADKKAVQEMAYKWSVEDM